MRYVSWFAGVGGFDLAFNRAGHECVGACEIEPHARRVYEKNFGQPAWFPKDITKVKPEEIPDADIWVGGSPCQGFSVAGKREGLADDRSGLWWVWHALMRERRPEWVLIENVPGILSSNDRKDWEDILDSLCDIGYLVDSEILDARHFGVAQRRRRVFLTCIRADAGLTRRTHFSEVLLGTLATQSLRDALIEASHRSVTIVGGTVFEFSDASRGLRRTMRSCESSLGKSSWPNLLDGFDALPLPCPNAPSNSVSRPSERSEGGTPTRGTDSTASGKTVSASPVGNTSRLWRRCWDGDSESPNSSTTSTATSPTTSERIFICSEAVLSISGRIAASKPCCQFCSNAAWSALTALVVSMSLLEETANDLFTENARRGAAWDLLRRLGSARDQLVQNLGEGADPVALLSVLEGGIGNPAAGGEAREGAPSASRVGAAGPGGGVADDVAGTLGGGSGKRGWCDDLDRAGAFPVEEAAYFEPRVARNGRGAPDAVAAPLKARSGEDGRGDSAPHVFSPGEYGGFREGAGTLRARDEKMRGDHVVVDSGEVAATLRESDGHHGRSSPRGNGRDNLVAYQGQGGGVGPMGTLRKGNGNATGGVPFVAQPALCIEDPGRKMSGGVEVGIGVQEEVAYTLQAGARHAVAQPCEAQEPMAVAENSRDELRLMRSASALAAGGGKPGRGYQAVLLPPEPQIIEGDSAASTPDLPRLRAGCGRGGETAIVMPPVVPGFDRTGGETEASRMVVAPALRTNPYNNSDPGMEAQMLVQGEPDAFYPHSGLDQVVQRGVSPPLTVGAGGKGSAKAPAVTAFSSKDDGRDATEDLSPTLRRGAHKDSHANAGVPPAVAIPVDLQNTKLGHGDAAGTLDTSTPSRGGGQAVMVPEPTSAASAGLVRRLTPTECERLQAFPDGWTCLCGCAPYSTAACRCSDGSRYRALGNAVCVNVVYWIARRLAMIPLEVPA